MRDKNSVSVRIALLTMTLIIFCFGTVKQTVAQEQQQGVVVDRSGKIPVYRVTVVARTAPAINYRHRSGPTEVDFRGTDLMPQARGRIIVNSKQGRIEIKATMEKLTPAT
ncbi:MAG TPA: hypothetical protein VE242_14030, partial [Chthoniobacterales bacterium]|nr:hypothetical protein [Chthoniobacterales bacterium]